MAYLRAFGSCLPGRAVDNAEIGALVGADPAWILGATGIGERRFAAPEDTVASLGARAAAACLEDAESRGISQAIASNQQDCASMCNVLEACCFSMVSDECAGKFRIAGGALVVNVVGLQNRPRELLQQIILFIGGAVGANHADRFTTARVANLLQLLPRETQRLLPRGRLQLALGVAHQRRGQPLRALHKVESEPPLGA